MTAIAVADGVADRLDDLARERARFSRLPPHWSRALVELGAEERAEQVVVAEVDLDGVEAGVARRRRARARRSRR